MWFHVQLCSVRMRIGAASSHSVGDGPSDSWMWSKASCACRASVGSIQIPVLDTRPCITTPVGGFWWASCMHRRICWAYAHGSGRLSAAAVICLRTASRGPYRLHVGRWGDGASVAHCRTRCMLSRKRVLVQPHGVIPDVQAAGQCRWARRSWGGSLVASTSMMLLWGDIWDGAIGPSHGVSDVLQESVCRFSSYAWSPLWSVPSLVVYAVGRLSGRGTVLAVAAWCCRLCFERCTRCAPGSACGYGMMSRWHCTQLCGHYSRCVAKDFGFALVPPLDVAVLLSFASVLHGRGSWQ